MQVEPRQRSGLSERPASLTPLLDTLQAVFEANRDSVLLADSSMRVVATNPSAQASFGRGGHPLAGRRLSEIIRDVDLHDSFRRALVGNASEEVRIEIVGTERRIYNVFVAPIALDGKQYVIGTFYDITQIERLEKVRQEFLSNISHELRTPLTSILAFVETLEDGAIDDSENNRRFLSTIRRNAERMHALIADILELSFIESGNISIDVKQVRVSNAVEEVFAALATKAAEREIGLISDISGDARVFADPMRLEQMLTNLIDNAIKFNRVAGTVTVSLSSNEKADLISVADTGEGLLEGHAQRIFERFYRVDRGRTREVGGTGLGLSIVKHLARLHGGEILVRSELGTGTVFTIELPRHRHLLEETSLVS